MMIELALPCLCKASRAGFLDLEPSAPSLPAAGIGIPNYWRVNVDITNIAGQHQLLRCCHSGKTWPTFITNCPHPRGRIGR